jgi:hypothetical protein
LNFPNQYLKECKSHRKLLEIRRARPKAPRPRSVLKAILRQPQPIRLSSEVSIEKGWPDIRHFSVHKFSNPSLTRAGFPFPLYLLEVLKHVIDSKQGPFYATGDAAKERKKYANQRA